VKRKNNVVKLEAQKRQRKTSVFDLSLSPKQKEIRRKKHLHKQQRYFWNRIFIAFWVIFLVGYLGYNLYSSPWPITTTLRHWGARPNCDMANLFGLAPSKRGQPGYYPWHDRDNDGIACEVWSRRQTIFYGK